MSKPATPAAGRGVERRQHQRRVIALEVRLGWGSEAHVVHTLDVSEGGALLISTKALRPPPQVVVRLMTPSLDPYRLAAEVVWTKRVTQYGETTRLGVHFGAVPAPARAELARLVAGGASAADDLPVVEADELVEADDALLGDEPMGDEAFADPAPSPPQAPVHVAPAALRDPFAQAPGAGPQLGDVVSAQDFARQLSEAVAKDHVRREEQAKEAERLIAEGRRAAAERRWKDAVRHYEKALQLVPESAEMVQELAAAAYESGDVIRAAELFDRALRLGTP